MPGCIGREHCAFLDKEGTVWTVGEDNFCQLGRQYGLGAPRRNDQLCPVPNIPPCLQVHTGANFTVCLTRSRRVYYFGLVHQEMQNSIPQLISGLPAVRAMAVGRNFMMFIGEDSSLWGVGANANGQLGLGHTRAISQPQKLEFKASHVACGSNFTLVIDEAGALYGCGYGSQGQLGGVYGHVLQKVNFQKPAQEVVCGSSASFVRCEDGSIWAAGSKVLGPADRVQRPTFTQIVRSSTEDLRMYAQWGRCGFDYLTNGVLYSTGYPTIRSQTTLIALRQDVKAVVVGPTCLLTLLENGKVMMYGDSSCSLLPGYDGTAVLWEEVDGITSDLIMESDPRISWQDYRTAIALTMEEESYLEQIDLYAGETKYQLQSRDSAERTTPPAPLALGSWSQCADVLRSKERTYQEGLKDRLDKLRHQKQLVDRSKREFDRLNVLIQQEEAKLARYQKEEQEMKFSLADDQYRMSALTSLRKQCEQFSQEENKQLKALQALLQGNSLSNVIMQHMSPVWWRAGFAGRQKILDELQISGATALELDSEQWREIGLNGYEIGQMRFILSMLHRSLGLSALQHLEQEDCVVCQSASVSSTRNLLRERQVKLNEDRMEAQKWITPYLVYAPLTKEECAIDSKKEYLHVMQQLKILRRAHEDHLQSLREEGQ